jgi:hypothetical protein
MTIKKMPSKKTLEKFLDGMHHQVGVYFDYEKGEFVDEAKRNNPKLQRPSVK